MLDILVALKMDLMQSAPSGIGDLQSRIDRASTIDAAIDDLERVVGISGTTTTAQRRLLKRV